MSERINRKTDETIYQPRIHAQRIRELSKLRERRGVPITVLVDQALEQFLQDNEQPKSLVDRIYNVLEQNNGLCMDNVEEREILAIAITQVISKGENHGQEATQETENGQ